MGYIKRLFKGRRTLKKILDAQKLTTEKTEVSVGHFVDEIWASQVLYKKTRSELLTLILPLINDYLNENYNDIKIVNDKIIVRKRNFLEIKGEQLTTGDFINDPKVFDIHKVNDETNAFFLSATTGIGKTQLAKYFIRRLMTLEPIIFSTTPDEYKKKWLVVKDNNIHQYNKGGIDILKNFFTRWLEDDEFRANDRSLIVLDEAFVLFAQRSKEIKELAELVNQFLGFNRKTRSRLLILGQTPNRESFNELNLALVGTKIVNIEDIANYKSFGYIPDEIKAQKLGRGEFYLFNAGNKALVLKYKLTQQNEDE